MADSQARLELILGSMFAGKTTELLRRVGRLQAAEKQVLAVCYTGDSRSGDRLATHDGHTSDAAYFKCPVVKCTLLAEVEESPYFAQCDVVAIDEGQFFDDIYKTVDRLLQCNKFVIVAGLDGNFRREPFGDLLRLIPRADHYHKLHACCKACSRTRKNALPVLAPFTYRVGDDDGEFMIGGGDDYLALCRQCYEAASHAQGSAPEN